MITPSPGYWDRVDPAFLAGDRNHPSRRATLDLVGEAVTAGARSIVEIGFGPAYDYELLRCVDDLAYRGLDISEAMVRRARERFCAPGAEAIFEVGTFADLRPASADIAYTRATLEHQPTLAEPLGALLRAARRLAIVDWYRPPVTSGESEKRYDPATGVWYCTWTRGSVDTVIATARSWPPSVEHVVADGHVIDVVRFV